MTRLFFYPGMAGESPADAPSGESGERTRTDALTDRRLDDFFDVLADLRRRLVLRYFRTCPDDVATVTDLADYVAERTEGDDFRSVTVTLHHKDVPKLVDAGLVEFDAQTETVKFVGPEFVFTVLDRTNARADGDAHPTAETSAVGHLYEALTVEDPVEKDYLVRQALQHIHFERD